MARTIIDLPFSLESGLPSDPEMMKPGRCCT